MDQRISIHLKCPNPLFEKWILEMYNSAVEKESKSQTSLKQALDSIKRYPLVLKNGSECAILKGFGKNLCKILDKKLLIYEKTRLDLVSSNNDEMANNKRPASQQTEQEKVLKKSKNEFVPGYRTGSYAILVTLLQNLENEILSLPKSVLQTEAQLSCDESMTKSKPGSFYTAWSSMSTLITKGYIVKTKKKWLEYLLTDSGIELARKLLKHSSNRKDDENIVFEGSHINLQSQSVEKKSPINGEINVLENIEQRSSQPGKDEDLICLEPKSFDVILLVDKQETSGKSKKNDATLLELEKYQMIKYELRHLKVGDFTWIARDRKSNEELILPHIVERKRMDDLAHSIKDGRFHEQKFRLKQCGIPNVMYLIESHGNNRQNNGLPLSSLKQAIANTRIQDGFLTHFTSSLGHSIKFLAMMTKLLCEKYSDKRLFEKHKSSDGFDDSNKSQLYLFEFKSFNSMASKTKTLTVRELFIKQLLQLKGLSVEKAVAITTLYPTPKRLMDGFNQSKDKPELLLANLKYGLQMNKVGPTISKTLYKFYTNPSLN